MARSLALLALMTIGCGGANTLTATVEVAPNEVAALGDRAYVVARHGERVTAEITYEVGDTIPGQGVVRRVPDVATTAGGAVIVALGLGAIGGGFAVSASCHPTDTGMFGCFGPAMGALGMIIGGVILTLGGIVVTVDGLHGHLAIEKQKTSQLRLTPSGLQF